MAGIVGVDAHGGVDLNIRPGQVNGLPRAGQVDTYVDNLPDAYLSGSRQHLDSVSNKIIELQMTVRIYEGDRLLPIWFCVGHVTLSRWQLMHELEHKSTSPFLQPRPEGFSGYGEEANFHWTRF